MTVTAQAIQFRSSYKVSDTATGQNTITTAQLEYLASEAAGIVDDDVPPGTSQGDYDSLHLMMVLSILESDRGETVMSGEKSGDYSYSKPSGTNRYLDQYNRKLDQIRRKLSGGPRKSTRVDGYMPSLELDQSPIPTLNGEDSGLSADQVRRLNNGGA